MKQTGKCRYCGSALYEGMRFCGHCGKAAEKPAGANLDPVDLQSGKSAVDMQLIRPQRDSISEQKPVRRERSVNYREDYDPNTYENRVRRANQRPGEAQGMTGNQRPNGQRSMAEPQHPGEVRSMAGNQRPSGQRSMAGNQRPGEARSMTGNQRPVRERYRQDEMETNWQQSWERKHQEEDEDDESFTPIQYVLIGIAVVLLMALVGFGVYWILGKSTGNTGRRHEQDQITTEVIQTGQEEIESQAAITILDDTQDKESEQVTEKITEQVSEKLTESEKTTEPHTESEKVTEKMTEERQTEKQTEKKEEPPVIDIISEDYYVIEEPTAEPDYSGGYLPESSQRALSDADVAGMSYDDLQMAINEIYARHGRIFQSESISGYFNSQSWYQGTVTAENFSESVFSSVESQNIQFLLDKMGN